MNSTLAIRVIIFAKAPIAGKAKTRLIPALGLDGSARLAHQLLQHCVVQALLANIGTVELCVSPAPEDPVWQQFSLPTNLAWSDQGGGDLGERMARAAQRNSANGDAVILIGTDCPALQALQLQQAADALRTADASIVPTSDGGYALLALKQFSPYLFSDMTWSTSSVAAVTLDRLRQLNWTTQQLDELHDIDEPADLQWLPPDWMVEYHA